MKLFPSKLRESFSKLRQANIPFVSYLIRTWPLLVAAGGLNFLTRWNHAVNWQANGINEYGQTVWQGLTIADYCGANLQLTASALLVFWLLGLNKHLYHRQTMEKDAQSGRSGDDWEELSSEARVRYTVIRDAAYALVIGLIAAALAK